MAPSFDTLRDEDSYDDEDEEIDFSGSCRPSRGGDMDTDMYPIDLREQYEVRLEEGLDAFVVIDGLPIVAQDSKQKLVKFLLRKLNTVGKTKEESIFMPINDHKMSEG